MTRTLHLSDDLKLPLEAVTQTIVLYGGKGMGKTNLGGGVLPEELAAAGLKFSIMDPVGVSWGLQYGDTKKKKGIEVLILGGVHGDIPIEPTAGAVVADLVCEESISTVIDISRHSSGRMWSNADQIKFVADYCTRLYERQGEDRRPIMQIFDEVGRFCPQLIPHGAPQIARCVGAIEKLVEWGRNVGIGVCLITQRSARMNKSISELAECMIAFRTVGPNSMKAISHWLGEHIEKDKQKEILKKLRSLPRGHALVVSPGWLQFEGVVPFRMRHTFDSSKTPEPGRTVRAPGKATKPDLQKYRGLMADTIEKAEKDSPKTLKLQISELQREVRRLEQRPIKTETKEVTIKTLDKDLAARLLNFIDRVGDAAGKGRALESELQKALKSSNIISKPSARIVMDPPPAVSPASRLRDAYRKPDPGANGRAGEDSASSNSSVSGPCQRIINSLAWLESVGFTSSERARLAFLSDQSPSSSAFANNLGKLRTEGFISYPAKGFVQLKDPGRGIANPQDAPTTDNELQAQVLIKLNPARRRILEALIGSYPEAMDRSGLGNFVGQSPGSSAFANNLGSLRTLKLLDYPERGMVKAGCGLFLEGHR